MIIYLGLQSECKTNTINTNFDANDDHLTKFHCQKLSEEELIPLSCNPEKRNTG